MRVGNMKKSKVLALLLSTVAGGLVIVICLNSHFSLWQSDWYKDRFYELARVHCFGITRGANVLVLNRTQAEIYGKISPYVPGPWGFYKLRLNGGDNELWTEGGLLNSEDEISQLKEALGYRIKGSLRPNTWLKIPGPVVIDPNMPPIEGIQTFRRGGEVASQYRFEGGLRVEARTEPPWWNAPGGKRP